MGADIGVGPIMERFFRPNYLFALEFQDGFVFGRVIRRRIHRYKLPLTDSNGANVTIGPLASQSELRFRDPRNTKNDILYLNTMTDDCWAWFMHGSIGIKPEQIYMYPRYPSGQSIHGNFPNIDPVRPASGDEISIINSEVSPYEQPSDYLEYVIMPGQTVSAEFYNKDPVRTFQPVVNLLFSTYWFQVLTKDKNAQIICDIATRRGSGQNAAYLTVGFGKTPDTIGEKLADEWGATPMTLDDAAALCGGR